MRQWDERNAKAAMAFSGWASRGFGMTPSLDRETSVFFTVGVGNLYISGAFPGFK
jgi:hypothetical protein